MKTTIEIADALLLEAKRVAELEKTTVRAIVEDGLRKALEERKTKNKPHKFKLVTVKGTGLQRAVPEDLPRELAYAQRLTRPTR